MVKIPTIFNQQNQINPQNVKQFAKIPESKLTVHNNKFLKNLTETIKLINQKFQSNKLTIKKH